MSSRIWDDLIRRKFEVLTISEESDKIFEFIILLIKYLLRGPRGCDWHQQQEQLVQGLIPQPFHLAHTFTYYHFPAAPKGRWPRPNGGPARDPPALGGFLRPTWSISFSAYLPQPVTCPDAVNRARVPCVWVRGFHLSTIFHAHCALCIRMTPPTAARSRCHSHSCSCFPQPSMFPEFPYPAPPLSLLITIPLRWGAWKSRSGGTAACNIYAFRLGSRPASSVCKFPCFPHFHLCLIWLSQWCHLSISRKI